MAFINAVVAQAILLKAGINIKAAFNYSRINIPEWLYWALSCSVASILFGSENIEYIGRNLSLIFLIPFLFDSKLEIVAYYATRDIWSECDE